MANRSRDFCVHKILPKITSHNLIRYLKVEALKIYEADNIMKHTISRGWFQITKSENVMPSIVLSLPVNLHLQN